MKITEKTGILIQRLFLAAIGVLFLGFGWFGKCRTGEEWLACKVTGSAFDIIGTILFLAPLVVLSGLVPAITKFMDSKEDVKWNLILFGSAVLGVILLWNL